LTEGLTHALCALSYFRHRHDRSPRYKKAKGARKQAITVGHYCEYIRVARDYIRQAREVGFRGSIPEAIKKDTQ
jgi:hypothetical protein